MLHWAHHRRFILFFGDRVYAEAALVRYNDLLRKSIGIHKLGLDGAERRASPHRVPHKKEECAVGVIKQCVVKQG